MKQAENRVLEKEQELRTRQKKVVKDNGFTVHSNRPDVRMMNGALYPISNPTYLTQMGVQDAWLQQDRGTAKEGNLVVFPIHTKHSVGMATAACAPSW